MTADTKIKSILSERDAFTMTKIASAMIVVARDIRNHDTDHREENIKALMAGANLLIMMLEESSVDCGCAVCAMQRKHPAPPEAN